MFEKGQQGFGAATELADDAGGFEEVGQRFARDALLGRCVAFVEDVGDGREAAVEHGPGGLRLGVGHQPLAGVGNIANAGNGHRRISRKRP